MQDLSQPNIDDDIMPFCLNVRYSQQLAKNELDSGNSIIDQNQPLLKLTTLKEQKRIKVIQDLSQTFAEKDDEQKRIALMELKLKMSEQRIQKLEQQLKNSSRKNQQLQEQFDIYVNLSQDQVVQLKRQMKNMKTQQQEEIKKLETEQEEEICILKANNKLLKQKLQQSISKVCQLKNKIEDLKQQKIKLQKDMKYLKYDQPLQLKNQDQLLNRPNLMNFNPNQLLKTIKSQMNHGQSYMLIPFDQVKNTTNSRDKLKSMQKIVNYFKEKGLEKESEQIFQKIRQSGEHFEENQNYCWKLIQLLVKRQQKKDQDQNQRQQSQQMEKEDHDHKEAPQSKEKERPPDGQDYL